MNSPSTIVHLTSSPSFGGPERQMLELGRELTPNYRSVFITFREEERCWDFVNKSKERGFEAYALQHDSPNFLRAYSELKAVLKRSNGSILFCHGYKSGILGRLAARSLGIPVIGVSRGWTSESRRVRFFEWLDRLNLRWMDKVICVSNAQADKVRDAGVHSEKIHVIHNAIDTKRFTEKPNQEIRTQLELLFPKVPTRIIGSAGRLSPEKGFDLLVDAAKLVLGCRKDVGFLLFGDGHLKSRLQEQIEEAGIQERFLLLGFTAKLDQYMPYFDLFVQSSHTEGLPNVLLEAAAAGTPVVATNVGGTPEVVAQERTGLVIPPNDSKALSDGICRLLSNEVALRKMSAAGPQHVATTFSFDLQAKKYKEVFNSLKVGI